MNNKFKKGISIITAVVTACFSLSLPIVSYAEESYEDNIYMSSFSDYTTNGLPNGWTSAKYLVGKVNGADQEVENAASYASVNNEDGNKSVYIDSTAGSMIKDIIPFGKVVSSGKLHITFDHKVPTNAYTGKQSSMIVTLFNMNTPAKYRDTSTLVNNYDPNDLYDFRGTVGHQQSHVIRVPYYNGDDTANNAVKVSTSGALYWTPAQATSGKIDLNKWYKFDIIIDFTKNTYDVWLDGVKITDSVQGTIRTDNGYNKFKGLSFLQQDGQFKKGLYDNIFITNYNDTDSVKMVAENLSSDENSMRIDIAFSEYLERAPEEGDFIITDSYTGDVIDYEIESSDGRHAVLKVNTDKAAKLNISFNKNSGLSGTISSKLSDKPAGIYTNVKKDGTVIPVLDNVSAVDYNGADVTIDGSKIVPIGTTTVNVSFSTPVALDGVQDKIYIQKADSDEKLNVNYTIADDNKSVKMDFAELMSADSEYKFVISDSIASIENENVFLPYAYEYTFKTSNDGGFGIFGDDIIVDDNTNTAFFTTSIIKSDENIHKGTIIICGYIDEEVDGKTYTKLEKIDVQKYDIETKSITSYTTNPIDISGLNRVKCFINDLNTHKLILISENEL